MHYIRHYQFLQQNKSTVLQRFYGFLVEHYFPFNDAIAEEMPYEQLPDFVETERPINRPEIRKAMLYIEKNLSKRVSLRRISEHIHLSESYFSKIFKDDTGLSVCNT